MSAPSSPVVPSVGAVPVEVPEDIPAEAVEKIAAAICPGESCEAHSECRDDVPAVWAAAYPLIAARVQAELEAEDECPRTTCQQIAATASDVYCEVTGGQLSYPTYDARTILSHANDQTQKLIDDECARVRAEERQRLLDELHELAQLRQPVVVAQDTSTWLASAFARIAAGSAVPVATPEPRCEHGKATPHTVDPAMEQIFWHEHPLCPGPVATPTPANDDAFELCEHGVIGPHTYGEDMEDQVAWRDCPGKRRPVATPTEPVDEVVCPNCEQTIRARMSDRPGPVRVSVVPGDGQRPLGGLTVEATPDGDGSLEVLVPEPVVLAWASNIEHAKGARSGWTPPAEQDGQR